MRLKKADLQFFNDNQAMIHSILKRCHISPLSPDYEDFVQLGGLHLLQILEKTAAFPLDKLPPAKRPTYLYQHLYWRLRDEQRHALRYQSKEELHDTPQLFDSFSSYHTPDFNDSLYTSQLLSDLLPLLTTTERRLLLTLIAHPMSLTHYAQQKQLARSSVYRHRKAIQKNSTPFFLKN